MIDGFEDRVKAKAVDAYEAFAYFENGSVLTLRSNRTSTGRKVFFQTTIHGNRGGVQWELENQSYVKHFAERQIDGSKIPINQRGWTHIHVSDPGSGGDGHLNTDTIPGMSNGYLQYFRWLYLHFGLQLLGQPDAVYSVPSFADACQVAAVTDAIYRSGKEGGKRIKVPAV